MVFPNGRLTTGWNLQKAACGRHLMYQSQAQNTAEGQESSIHLLLVVRQAVAEKSETTLSSNFQEVPGKTEQFRTIWTELAAVSEQLSSCSRAVRNCSAPLFGTVRTFPGPPADSNVAALRCSQMNKYVRWLRCGVRICGVYIRIGEMAALPCSHKNG